jgi:uncharacterized protein YqjF (DUF2071 family)
MHEAFKVVSHRPYPLNPKPWLMQQEWRDLAFLHWRVDQNVLRPFVPTCFELELFDGSAWIGVVPFHMFATPRWVPRELMHFGEINVRTYVRRGGKSGVYFFSLDASHLLPVFGARWVFHLPYHFARIWCEHRPDGGIGYESRSVKRNFRGTYKAFGDVFNAEPGSLEHFLTERYCLMLEYNGEPYCVDIQHGPWELQRAEARIDENTVAYWLPHELAAQPDHAMFTKRTVMVNWALERME